MASDGQIYVGMSFGTVKSACKQVADTARKIGTTVERNHDYTTHGVGGEYKIKSGKMGINAEVGFYTHKTIPGYGNIKPLHEQISYNAKIGGRVYTGHDNKYYGNNQDAIMQLKFTKVYSADGLQYAEDKNGNGIVDKGEIFDCMW